MGWQEPFCQICGVHFNVARVRRIDEPLSPETAWHQSRPPWPPLKPSAVKSVPYIRVKKNSKPHPACEVAGCSNEEGDHAAGGPGCGVDDGYNGWRITYQEMDLITRVQCLVLKPDHDYRLPDDDGVGDFEYETEEWVLTAVSRGSAGPSEALKVPYIKGIGGDVHICNYDIPGTRMSIPFHPMCFQVYKRVCMEKKGKVNIDWIADYHDLCSNIYMAQTLLDRHADVHHCSVGPNWTHIPGTEWLAADPITIPRLQALIDECTLPQDNLKASSTSEEPLANQEPSTQKPVTPNRYITRSMTRSATRSTTRSATRSKDEPEIRNAQDPFLQLSVETRSTIIEFLQDDTDAVARLRLSSRAFRKLPQFFYRTLITTLMPWIWEAQDLIAEQFTVDWEKLWKELCRVDGFFMRDASKKSGFGDDEEEGQVDYHFSREPGEKNWRVYKNEYDRVSVKPCSELWEKAANNYVKPDDVRILGLRNRIRVWEDCVCLLSYVDDIADGKLKREGGELRLGPNAGEVETMM